MMVENDMNPHHGSPHPERPLNEGLKDPLLTLTAWRCWPQSALPHQEAGASLTASARTRGADVRHYNAREAGGVEVRGDDVRPQLRIIRNSIRTHGLPERIALHFARCETHVAPTLGTL